MNLQIRTETAVAARIVVRPIGKLDAVTCPEFDRALDEVLKQVPRGGTLVIDLVDLEYISSAGLRSLFRARKTMRTNGGFSLLVHAQPQVRKVFEIVKAVPVHEVFSSVEELDAYLAEMQRKVVQGDED
ncbi:MAG TPA: STAS domain-containing protein [Rudaea sp.]|jgi:anti-sigma B factor antagonist|nr:STAS domain-containing protein [Rudaea sp.]